MYSVKKNSEQIRLYDNFEFARCIISNQDAKPKKTSKFSPAKSAKLYLDRKSN